MGNSGIPGGQSAMFDQFSLIKLGSGSGNLLTGMVPEPTSSCLAFVGLCAVLGLRRRGK